MEEEILLELRKMNHKIEDLEQKMDEKIDALEQKMDDKIDTLEQQTNVKIIDVEQRLSQKIDDKIEDAKKEILDHYFLFEQEYGYKIDAILDIVMTEAEKSEEKAELIRSLDQRMSKQELRILALEQKCFKS